MLPLFLKQQWGSFCGVSVEIVLKSRRVIDRKWLAILDLRVDVSDYVLPVSRNSAGKNQQKGQSGAEKGAYSHTQPRKIAVSA